MLTGQILPSQMSKDVTTFLTWAAEPHLNQDKNGLKSYYLSYYIYSVDLFEHEKVGQGLTLK